MGITWTVIIVIALIGFVLFKKRNEFFPSFFENKKKVPEPKTKPVTAETVSTETVSAAPTTPKKKEEQKEKEVPNEAWNFFKPILGFVLGAGLILWIGFGAYHHFYSKSKKDEC